MDLQLKVLEKELAVCQIDSLAEVDTEDEFFFLGKTDQELSLVCSAECVPAGAKKAERGWRGFRIEGMLDFSMIGILAGITGILSENQVGIFAVSTYDTDYIFTREGQFETALSALRKNGYIIKR